MAVCIKCGGHYEFGDKIESLLKRCDKCTRTLTNPIRIKEKQKSKEKLLNELQRQPGVTTVNIPAYECKSIGPLEVSGPATVVIIRE